VIIFSVHHSNADSNIKGINFIWGRNNFKTLTHKLCIWWKWKVQYSNAITSVMRDAGIANVSTFVNINLLTLKKLQ